MATEQHTGRVEALDINTDAERFVTLHCDSYRVTLRVVDAENAHVAKDGLLSRAEVTIQGELVSREDFEPTGFAQ